MMTIFKCLRSGNTMDIKDESDISVFRNCESYIEVSNEEKANEEAIAYADEKRQVLRGRPKKTN